MSISRLIIRQSGVSFGIRVGGLSLALLVNVLLTRTLGASGFGAYAIALGYASIAGIFVRFGLDNSALRFVSVYRDKGEAGALRGFLWSGLSVIGGLWLICAGLAAGAWVAGWPAIRSISPLMLAGAIAMALMLGLTGFLSAILRIFDRIAESQAYDQMLRPALLGVALLVLLGSAQKIDPETAMLLSVAALLVPNILMLWRCHSLVRAMPAAPRDFRQRRAWLAVTGVLFIMTLLQETLNQIDLILLGHFATAREAALFATAQRLSTLSTFGLAAIGTVSGPRIAAAFHRGDLDQVAGVAKLSARVAFAFAGGVALVLLIAGPWVLALFGPEFVAATPVLQLLLVGALVNAATGLCGYLLVLTGHERIALGMMGIALAAVVIAETILIPRFGAYGAAMGSVIGVCLWNGLMLFFVRRLHGIDASVLGIRPSPSRR